MRIFVALLLVCLIVIFGIFQVYTTQLYDGDVRYLEDKNSTLSITDLIQRDWSKDAHSPVTFGYSDSSFWFYIPVGNELLALGENPLLEIDFPTIDLLDFFIVSAAGAIKYEVATGTDFRFDSRAIWDDDWIFPLSGIQRGDAIIIKAKTSNSLQLPIRVYQHDAFYHEDLIALIFWGGYYGLMTVMVVYSVLNSIVMRDKLFFYYALYVISTCLTSASLNGHGFAYLWPDTPIVNSYSLTAFTCLIIFFGTIFSLEYLGFMRARSPIRYIAISFALAAIGIMFYSVSLAVDLSFWTAVLVLLFSVVLIVMGALAVNRGHYLGWYFLCGWSVFLFSMSIFALNVLGLLPFNVITVHSKEVGSAFEIIMLSLGMAAMYNHEKEERYRIDSAIDGMNQRLQKRLNLINSKSGVLEIPQLGRHFQDIRNLDRRIHQEMGRLLVVAVQVIDKTTRRPDYIAQADCLRGLFNSRVTVFPFNTQREGLLGEITVLVFPLHNKFEAEPILERVEHWRFSLGEQYDLHFGYAISHLTEKYEVDYIEESLHNLEEAIQRRTVAYSMDDTLGFAPRQQMA